MSKKKYFLISTVIIISLFVWGNIFFSRSGNENGEEKFSIVRTDKSLKSDEGEKVAEIYYNKPVFLGNSIAGKKINAFFEEEEQGWFDGVNRLTHFREGQFDDFLESADEMRKAMGENTIIEQPFIYTVDTKIMQNDKDIISILQITTIQLTGPKSSYYFGSTFNLNTGELLPIDYFVETEPETLTDMIISFLDKESLRLELFLVEDELKRIYGRQNVDGYKVEIDDYEQLLLNFEYFFDGTYFYLILNHDVFSDNGCIMRWNGKSGTEFEASLMGCIVKKNKEIDEIEY